MASVHVILKSIRQRLRVAVRRKVVRHDSKSDLPQVKKNIKPCKWYNFQVMSKLHHQDQLQLCLGLHLALGHGSNVPP